MYVYVIQYTTCVPAASPDDGLRFSPKDFLPQRPGEWETCPRKIGMKNMEYPRNILGTSRHHGISDD